MQFKGLMEYDLELDKAMRTIKRNRAKTVCIQLPEGLKPKATQIVKELEGKTSAKVMIWADTCFGACDIPQLNVDLLIQWGHSVFEKV